MSDVLERLRADNPVRAGTPPTFEDVWARLERQSKLPSRRRPWLGRTRVLAVGWLAMIPVAVVTVIAISTLGQRRAPAGSGASGMSAVLVHYRARTVFRPAASSGASFAYEVDLADVWVSGAWRHRVETSYFFSRNGRQQGAPLRLEIATNGHRLEHFQAGSLNPAGQLTVSPATRQEVPCLLLVDCGPNVSVDPLSEVRQLYRTGAISLVASNRTVNGRQVDELKAIRGTEVAVIFVDTRSFLPIEVTDGYARRPWPATPLTTTTISDYQRLLLTASNRRLLRMRPHPEAQLRCAEPGGGGPVQPISARGCTPSGGQPPAKALPPLPGHLVAQINLSSLAPNRSPAGIAEIFHHDKAYLIRITARGVAPNAGGNAYALWLTDGPNKAHLLGFVTPRVGTNGRLSTEGDVPADAASYKHLLITLERTPSPHHPGRIVLEGKWPL